MKKTIFLYTAIFIFLITLGCKQGEANLNIGNTSPSQKGDSLNSDKFVNDTTGIDTWEYLFSLSKMTSRIQSTKVRNLIPKKERFNPIKISDSEFKSLNVKEHFVHSFYYPESYYQSCSMFGYPDDIFLKIPSLLKRQDEGLVMSPRQRNAISQNRDSCLLLIRECIEKSNGLSDDFKKSIIHLNAFELIPDLIESINKQEKIKDPYILTTLCLLMRYDFEPFKQSQIYATLYPSDSFNYYRSREGYNNSIPFTWNNYQSIINHALDYFEFKNNQLSEFVQLSGKRYSIGKKGQLTNPQREVQIEQFQISRYEITNEQFERFIQATSYVTLAEKNKDAFVFRLGLDEFEWIQDSTANWKFPNGISEGGIDHKMNHPVTCISFIDAQAYCTWAKVRLPTINEWEIASRGGNNNSIYYFGDSTDAIYDHANIWHGKTHLMKSDSEDFLTTSPVGSYKSNPIGLFDIYGNVFEFCSDVPEAFEVYENVVATRGGSWWCSIYACGFFNSIDIGRVQKEATFSNNGFRVAR